MKTYVFMTSVALLAGVSLGYWAGHGRAQTELANACIAAGLAVVYDHQSEEKRRVHCFELKDPEISEPPARRQPGIILRA
jgi:hypothetical protein